MHSQIAPYAAFIQRRLFAPMTRELAPREDGFGHVLAVAILTGLIIGLCV